jgi:hypothetical protein
VKLTTQLQLVPRSRKCEGIHPLEEVETEERKWLRQQSKDFNAAGFDALIKRWHKCISVAGG